MGYLQEFEAELQDKLQNLPEDEQQDLVRFIKAKILESYKNGIGQTKQTNAKGQGKFNRKRFFRQ